ncbi:hypothetical protein J437_LFUL014754 [Ladona fulva]|uniref:Adenylate cyclase N-terminal domain-containing protein n=1 Tax=Ladona fulva TaxID=123851 RepID=A0A8K0P411_LADFU|nr:hypothetical protein J437_LFUL014754 [Ladona fulva]
MSSLGLTFFFKEGSGAESSPGLCVVGRRRVFLGPSSRWSVLARCHLRRHSRSGRLSAHLHHRGGGNPHPRTPAPGRAGLRHGLLPAPLRPRAGCAHDDAHAQEGGHRPCYDTHGRSHCVGNTAEELERPWLCAEAVFLSCASGAGVYYRRMTEAAHERTFEGTRTCIESRVKLECEKEQQEQLLLSVIPAYIAAEVSENNSEKPQNIRA